MIKFTIALALVASLQLALAATAPDMPDCSKIDEVLDDLGGAQGLTVLNDKYKLAGTPEDFVKRCQEMSEAIKTLKRYNSKCHKSLTQQVFSAILRTRQEFNELHCNRENPISKEAYAAVQCIREQAFDSVKGAELKTIIGSQVLYEAKIEDEKLRLRRACCNVISSKELFVAATKEKCAKYEKIYADYVDSYTKEAMGLICPAELKCSELEQLKMEGAEPKHKFFLSPMIQLIQTLDH